MPLSKEKRVNPTQKHLNSHCYIVYKKTLRNMVRSQDKNLFSIKKMQPNILQNFQITQKNSQSPKNELFQQTKRILKPNAFLKLHNGRQTLKLQSKRPKTLSHERTQKHLFFPYTHKDLQNDPTKTIKIRTSTKVSTDNQNQTTIISTLKQENKYFKSKYIESEQKINSLFHKLHEQKKIHQAQKSIYQERIRKLKNLIQENEKEKEKTLKEIKGDLKQHHIKYKVKNQRIPFRVLTQEEQNYLVVLRQQDENDMDLLIQSNIIKKNSNRNTQAQTQVQAQEIVS